MVVAGWYSVASNRSAVRIQSSANFYMEHLFTVNCIDKTKIKKKRPEMAHFLIKEQHYLFLGYTMAFVRRPENILLLYTYFIREVSLYGWTTPVLLAKIHLFDYVKIIDRFTCLVKSKPVKQEVSCTVILPPSYHGVTSPRQVIFRANYFVEVLATPLANLRFGQ